ncbi:hypothetical protein CVT25_007259 [Psilocybe cyanescens]|uniref:Uncharacterized protein n=1 Tax=Psilocybe cyanescens TaxID=93625 RepID=A0A409WVD5_PSICY|nr:hypothetical protein CVT25_007259 [Psilocybe cyanescens]
MLPRTRILHKPSTILCQCRNASTRKAKQVPGKHLKTSSNAHKSSSLHKIPTSNLANQTWVIETRIPFFQAKLRTVKSTRLILTIVGLAMSSIYFTSSAITSPTLTSPPEKNESDTTQPTESFTDAITAPVKFVLRPILVDDDAREAAKKSWRYWAGLGSGIGAITLFIASHCTAPRYARYISISPATPASASAVGKASKGNAIMQIYPAFSNRSVSRPISQTTLVSPLLDQSEERSILRTIRILGAGATLPKLGWGVCMFRQGALVNGKLMSQQEVVELMERIWVDNGGMIKVAKS